MNPIKFDDFLSRAKKVHGNTYDYTLASENFTKLSEKIPIICNTHGLFYQTAKNHLKGNGCKNCSLDAKRKQKLISLSLQYMKIQQTTDQAVCKMARLVIEYDNPTPAAPPDGESVNFYHSPGL